MPIWDDIAGAKLGDIIEAEGQNGKMSLLLICSEPELTKSLDRMTIAYRFLMCNTFNFRNSTLETIKITYYASSGQMQLRTYRNGTQGYDEPDSNNNLLIGLTKVCNINLITNEKK